MKTELIVRALQYSISLAEELIKVHEKAAKEGVSLDDGGELHRQTMLLTSQFVRASRIAQDL